MTSEEILKEKARDKQRRSRLKRKHKKFLEAQTLDDPLPSSKQDEVFVEGLRRQSQVDVTHLWDMNKSQLESLVLQEQTFVRQDDDQTLRQVLQSRFKCIISHIRSKRWTYERQINSIGNGYLEVNRGENRFEQVYANDLRKCFIDKQSVEPFNGLDVAADEGRGVIPYAIQDVSLLHIIERRRIEGHRNRDTSGGHVKFAWALLTHGPTVSYYHADQGGKATVICVTEGRKVWYIPNGAVNDAREFLAMYGARATHHTHGASRISLDVGSILIQAPGVVHAVETPGDCLAVGAHFYTAALYADSIECLSMALGDELLSNDALTSEDFKEHVTIISHLDDPDIFTDQERETIALRVHAMLRRHGYLVWKNERWFDKVPANAKSLNGFDAKDEDARQAARDMLKSFARWWRAYFNRQGRA